MGEIDSRKVIDDVLVYLFSEIWRLEENAIITGEFVDITVNDMHVIQAVGPEGGKMSDIAAKLGITVGSLTSSMNSLVKKEYVQRHRTEQDRRVVLISLTEKGKRAYEHHEQFHVEMVNAAIQSLNEEEIPILARMLGDLTAFFRKYQK
jgi:DNA-binding MarR family transcriptional regulator